MAVYIGGGSHSPYLPPLEHCDECGALTGLVRSLEESVDAMNLAVTQMQGDLGNVKSRVTGVENKIGNKVNTQIGMTDSQNHTVSVTVLAE